MGHKGLVVAGVAAFALLGGGAIAASRYVSGTGCGYWRWPVKTGSDADRYRVNGAVVNTSIWFLTHLPPPSTFPQDARIAPVEDHIYQLGNVTLTQYKLEDDGDIHLIVRDAAGRSMITELPDPHCVSSSSLWRSRIAAARRNFTLKFPVTTYWHYLHRRVEVQGLGFFDREHGQDGVAPNDIELHPVIWLWVAPTAAAPAPAPGYPRPPAPSAWCGVTASYNATYGDYDVYVHSNQDDQTVTVTDSAGDSKTWHTDGTGYADVYLTVTGSAAGQRVTANVGAAACSTTL